MSPAKTLPASTAFGPHIKVAIIGAGVSGICTAAHLLKHGISVTVFERSSVAGGVWNYESNTGSSPSYPSERPSASEYNKFAPTSSELKAFDADTQPIPSIDLQYKSDDELWFAPPGACYDNLKTNVPTSLMYSSLKPWPKTAESYVGHSHVKLYLEELSKQFGVHNVTQYGTRVDEARQGDDGSGWIIRTVKLYRDKSSSQVFEKEWYFDALVVASGHYNLPRVPNITGLAEIKARFSDRVIHSKEYRNAKAYEGKHVLVVGGGTSAVDISQEINQAAATVTQSTRNGQFDLSKALVPSNVSRVAEVVELRFHSESEESAQIHTGQPIPADVLLKDGTVLQGIDCIILATGYLFSFPFLPQFHHDDTPAEVMSERGLVGAEGTMVHNLHKDIFYIEDPSLAFVGLPYHLVTFSTFDCQAQAVARVFSGFSRLPTRDSMRMEYDRQVEERGLGLKFHSQMDKGREIEYVRDLIDSVSKGSIEEEIYPLQGHSEAWLKEHALFQHVISGEVKRD